MADAAHWYGGALSLGPGGDLAMVSGTVEGEQAVVRRICTRAGGLVWHPSYGGGAGQAIGQNFRQQLLAADLAGQVAQEAAVALDPPPQVTLSDQGLGTISARISYTDSATLAPVLLGIDVTP